MKIPRPLVKLAGFCVDCVFRLMGDKRPNSYKAFELFTTNGAAEFNKNNPDDKSVYYQSYAFAMKRPSGDIFMALPNYVVGRVEGENDGLLTPQSAKWGNFKGTLYGAGNRGVSHYDETDLRRRRLSKKSGGGVSDIVDVYKDIVRELADMGF